MLRVTNTSSFDEVQDVNDSVADTDLVRITLEKVEKTSRIGAFSSHK